MRWRQLSGAAVLAAALLAGRGEAAVVLDQSTFTANDNGGGDILSYPSPYYVQTNLQTVTAGVTGILDELDLKIGLTDFPGTFQVILFDSGWVSGQAAGDYGSGVYTANLQATSGAAKIFKIDVSSADFHVDKGQVFSFSIRPVYYDSIINEIYYLSTPQPYAGGFNYIAPNTGLPYNFYPGRAEAQFQTYVDNGLPNAAPTPEPASWALMIGGFGMIGSTLRRRRAPAPLPYFDRSFTSTR
jgi:hypothetical protein